KGGFKRGFEVVAQIGTARGGVAATAATTTAPAAHEITEEIFKNIGEIGEIKPLPARAGAAHAALKGRMAETVIGGTLLLIFKNIVGLADFFEFLLGGLVAGVAVGVIFHRQF